MFSRLKKKELRPEAALIRCEELCARAEQCEFELRRKLSGWGIGEEDSDAIISSLTRRRFLDENRYAAAFVRDKYRFARWGRRKITMAMQQKRIDPDVIDEALGQIDEDEYQAILAKLLTMKARTMEQPLSYGDRTKLFRYALSRGFESGLASSLIKKLTSR